MALSSYEQVCSYDSAVVARGQREELVPCKVQPRDLEVIEMVQRCKFLTTPQLLELWWPGAAPQVGRRRLTKLFEAGYIDRFRPVARRGSFPWTYQLGREGHRLLQRAGRLASSDRFEGREIYDYRYVLHEIHLYSWVIAWRRLLGEQLLSWDGETQIPPPPELRRRMQRPLADELGADGLKDPVPKLVRPDATVEIARRDGQGVHTFLIEYDRTRRVDKNFEKFRRYDTFATWWWRHTTYGEGGRVPWILFVCQDEEQRDRFIAHADLEVTGHAWEPSGKGDADFAGRRRMLFTSESDVHHGEAVAHGLPLFPRGHEGRTGAGAAVRTVRLPGSAPGAATESEQAA